MTEFPKHFIWGTATSSYQIEGAWLEGGKGLSIWDAFCHTPGKIKHGHTGDMASDFYHRYKDDIALMAQLGYKNYRFSLSWPRIQPTGYGKPNPQGIRFYSDLIDTLLEHGITPWITLYHWDLPLALQLEHHGWLNPKTAEFFVDYADICFEHFGDRVKHWITLNEPWVVAILGFHDGAMAPGRSSNHEPYLVGHQLLRAHGLTVERYRQKFQSRQKGMISLSNNCDWREPLTDSPQDQAAAQRAVEFFLGWFADPVFLGDYPEVMRSRLGDRLPQFTDKDRELIHGSGDFFGLNHYTTLYCAQRKQGEAVDPFTFGNGGIMEDQDIKLVLDPSWETTTMGWAVAPWGCRKLLNWIDKRYDHPPIFLTENGCALPDQVKEGRVNDQKRIEFLNSYIRECHQAIQQGIDLRGYFCWSFMDNFEWSLGFSQRFGLVYIDYNNLKRYPKDSAFWYGNVIRNNVIQE
jgi:beta-glucosidase